MRNPIMGLLLAVVWMGSLGFAQVQQTPDLDGYITSITSSTDFAVNGNHVICLAKTHYHVDGCLMQTQWISGPYIGQRVKVFGKKDHTSHTVTAKEIVTQGEELPGKEGFGIIDRVLPRIRDSAIRSSFVPMDTRF
jgi:Domain of unknown function (DUF5666)